MVGRALLVPVLLLLVGSVAAAHEFWIEPSSTRAEPGTRVGFRLYVGDGFPGEPYARNPRHVDRFEVSGPTGVVPVPGRAGDDPAGRLRVTRPGLYVVAYSSRPTRLELEAERFNTYLDLQGLEYVRRLREQRGESELPGRELFSRCAKTLFAVGGGASGGQDHPVGLELELVAESDPFSLEPGDVLELRALHRGEPLPGLLLKAFVRDFDGAVQEARTDPTGRASFELDAPGLWLISGVYMTASHADDVDWESLWSSLTVPVAEPGSSESARRNLRPGGSAVTPVTAIDRCPPEWSCHRANQLLEELLGWRILEYQVGVFPSSGLAMKPGEPAPTELQPWASIRYISADAEAGQGFI